MKPKSLLRITVSLCIFMLCISFLESKRKASISYSNAAVKTVQKANGTEESNNDFIFCEPFSRYLIIPVAK